MAKVELIKLDPTEMFSEMAFTMAYCVGADYENAEEIANNFTPEEVEGCITLIRERLMENNRQN